MERFSIKTFIYSVASNRFAFHWIRSIELGKIKNIQPKTYDFCTFVPLPVWMNVSVMENFQPSFDISSNQFFVISWSAIVIG